MNNRHDDEPMFIGWADTPPADRRFFLRAGVGLTTSAALLGFGVAALQRPPDTGRWDPDAVREWRGIVTAEPYAMLRTNDLGGGHAPHCCRAWANAAWPRASARSLARLWS